MKKKSALFTVPQHSCTADRVVKPRKNSRMIILTLFFSAMIMAAAGCMMQVEPELYNIHWRPVGDAPESVFLLFTSDRRRVVGCCGSNRFFGPVSFRDGSRVEIGMLGATRMASAHYKYEQKFLDDLQAAKSYFFEKNGDLVLLDIDGEVCMRLRAVPAERIAK